MSHIDINKEKEKQQIEKIKASLGIKVLLERQKYLLALKAMREYLRKYPKEDPMRLTFIRILKKLGYFEEAKEEVKHFSTTKLFDEVYLESFWISIKEGKIDKDSEVMKNINMYIYQQKEANGYYYQGLLFLRNILFHMESEIERYYNEQIMSYDRDKALNYVNNSNIIEKFALSERFNVSVLFQYIEQALPKAFKNCTDSVMDIYLFRYPTVDKKKSFRYLKVITIPNSYHIISINEVSNLPRDYIINEFPRLYLYETGKVKKMSQIEKFNRKYGNK